MDRILLASALLIVGAAVVADRGTGLTNHERALPLTAAALEGPPKTQVRDDWRRTARGWERTTGWRLHPDAARARRGNVHPGLVAAFLVLASLGSLLAFNTKRRPPPGS